MPRARAKPAPPLPRPEPPTLVGSFPDRDYTPTQAAESWAACAFDPPRLLNGPVWALAGEGWAPYGSAGTPRFRGHFQLRDGERTYTIELSGPGHVTGGAWWIYREAD
jgi:hypothetical protein